MVRLGLIGAGRWGRNVIRTIRQSPTLELSAVASRNPATADLIGPETRLTGDWCSVVYDGGTDGVVIATPPALHCPMTCAAVEARRPVFVEKPLTLTPSEAQSISHAVETHDGLVWVDHIYLFHPAYALLKDRAVRAGRIDAITALAGGWGPFRDDTSVLWDWGPHDIAMCLDLVGTRPVSAGAERLSRRQTDEGVGESLVLHLSFSTGCVADIHISNIMPCRVRRFSVSCGDGILVFDDQAAAKLSLSAAAGNAPDAIRSAQPIDVGSAELPLTRALRLFGEAIASGSRDRRSLHLGVDVVGVLAHLQAALEGP